MSMRELTDKSDLWLENIIFQIATTREQTDYILYMLCIYQARYLVFYF